MPPFDTNGFIKITLYWEEIYNKFFSTTNQIIDDPFSR